MTLRRFTPFAAGLAMCLAAQAQPCSPDWLPGPPIRGADDDVNAAIVFDFDGDGPSLPELVIAGNFRAAGSASACSVARWDGLAWRPVGDAQSVSALTTYDPDGTGPLPTELVAACYFQTPTGYIPAVAAWDGSQWQILGSELQGPNALNIYTLQSFDPDGSGPMPPRLFAGGYGTTFRAIAQWDGEHWLQVGGGMSDPYSPAVYSFALFDPDGSGPQPEQLIAGGSFSAAAATPASGVAAWNGSAWSELGAGVYHPEVHGYAWAMTTFDADGPGPGRADLIVGGLFDQAGGLPARSIAAWDGSSWRPIPGLDQSAQINALGRFDPDGSGPQLERLVVFGSIYLAGGHSVRNIVLWDGTAWSPMGSGIAGAARTLAVYDADGPGPSPPALFAGGSFSVAGDQRAFNIARWDGQDWRALGAGFDRSPAAFCEFDPDGPGPAPPQLFAGGGFTFTPDGPASGLCRFDGAHWHSIPGLNGSVGSLVRWSPDGVAPARLVASGYFSLTGGAPAYSLAMWNGQIWESLGNPGLVGPLITFDFDGPLGTPPTLVIGGTDYAIAATLVKRWTGSGWQQLGEAFSTLQPHVFPSVHALVAFDPDGPGEAGAELYACGNYLHLSGQTPLQNIARWDGSAWLPVGTGHNGNYWSLAVYDADGQGPGRPELIAGGQFGGHTLARWDGVSWTALAGSTYETCYALTSLDPDGAGPLNAVLIAAGRGQFGAPAVNAANIGRWDGVTLESLGDGVSGANVGAFALGTWTPPGSSTPQLAVGGTFSRAGAHTSAAFAVWGCLLCYPNCDNSTLAPSLNINDHICFLNRFAASDPYANCDGSTASPVLNVGDFICFMNKYAAGCP